jgi:hypothetical protein
MKEGISRTKAVRQFCLECSGVENRAEVTRCTAKACALWPFRMGSPRSHELNDHLEAVFVLEERNRKEGQ